MGLRDLANEVLAGFNPKTDDPNAGGTGLPDGEYDVTLDNVEFKVYNSGWEALSLRHEVTIGEQQGQKEFINLGFSDKTPDFVLQKNIKVVAKLAAVIGLQLTDEDWDDEESLANAFKEGVGSQFVLKITSSPNKKDPSNPYKNYDFIAYDDGETLGDALNDEELPY